MKETKTVEKEKVVAEKLNGRFAMMGFIALVGAYLTTCLLYTSDAADDTPCVDLGGRRIIKKASLYPY